MADPEQILARLTESRLFARYRYIRDDVIADAVAVVATRYPDLSATDAARVVFTVARRAAHTALAKASRESKALEAVARIPRPVGAEPVAAMIRQEQTDALQRALTESLTHDERELILRHFFHGQSLRAMAAERGQPVSTVAYQLHGAVSSLRRVLRHREP